MPRQSKLKLFRTAIGFHDVYVAAPSQKAALEAWGSDSNLFAVGAAERVEDSDMMREALANPGAVIKRPRGTMAEHMAALPKTSASPREKPKAGRAEEAAAPARKTRSTAGGKAPRPKPRPVRTPVDRAEAALAEAESRHEEDLAALAKRQAELDRARHKLEAAQAREREGLEHRLEAARDSYERAMRAWRAR
jgi:hypothetical protein